MNKDKILVYIYDNPECSSKSLNALVVYELHNDDFVIIGDAIKKESAGGFDYEFSGLKLSQKGKDYLMENELIKPKKIFSKILVKLGFKLKY